MIPKVDGDATPLGQRPLSVLPVVYRIWASARMEQLNDWCHSWLPDSVRVFILGFRISVTGLLCMEGRRLFGDGGTG